MEAELSGGRIGVRVGDHVGRCGPGSAFLQFLDPRIQTSREAFFKELKNKLDWFRWQTERVAKYR